MIIGAGPAGSVTSLFLSKKSIPHTIIDKAKFPRDIICGDAISPKVVNILSKLDKNILRDLISDKNICSVVKGITFYSPNGDHVDIQLSSSNQTLPYGLVSKRLHFDNYLFNQIKNTEAQIFQNAEAKKVFRNNGKITLEFIRDGILRKINSDLIIGADGYNSIVSDKKEYALAVRTYFENVERINPDNYLELHYMKEYLPGYFWIFPMPDGTSNVGLTMMRKDVIKNNLKLGHELNSLISHHPNLKNRFKNAVKVEKIMTGELPLGLKKRKIFGDNYLLVGDAVALIDPFTQEGMGNAMLTGMLAAETISLSIEKNDYSAKTLSGYERLVNENLNKELKINKRLHSLVRNPYFFNLITKKLKGSESMKKLLSLVVSDTEQRSQIVKTSLYNYVFK